MPIAKGDAATSALLFFAIDDEWAREEGKEAAVNRALEAQDCIQAAADLS